MAKKAYIGVDTEIPVYEESTNTVSITADNISEYFTVNNGSYYFRGSGSVFTTTNGGVDSSTASTVLTAKQDISSLTFNYSYSSEANWDKFTLKVGGTTVENAVSGATTNKSYSGSLTSGQKIEFSYSKDGSASSNNDKCTFSAMTITSVVKTQIGAEIKPVARKIEKAYIGVDTEFPVYDTNLTNTTITASNISTYFKVTNGSYYFAGSGSTFTSNNKGVHSTTATTTLTALQDYSSLSFTYSYSGESSYDYLNLKVNGVSVATNASGSTTTKTYTGSILAGQKIEFSFRKDGSVDRYDDCATWSNMVVSAKVQIGTEIKSVARLVRKIYIGDSSGLAKLIYEEDPWSKLVSKTHAPYVKTRGVHFRTAVALSSFNPFYQSSYGGSTSFPPSTAFQVWINKKLTTQSYQSITCAAGDDVLIKLIDESYYYPLFHQYNTSNNYFAAILDPYPQMYMSSGVLATDWNRCFQSCTKLSSVHKYFLCNNPQITNMNYFFWNSSSHTAPTPIYINARGVSTATNWYNGVTNTVAFYVIDGSTTKSTFSSSSSCRVNVWDGNMSDCKLP